MKRTILLLIVLLILVIPFSVSAQGPEASEITITFTTGNTWTPLPYFEETMLCHHVETNLADELDVSSVNAIGFFRNDAGYVAGQTSFEESKVQPTDTLVAMWGNNSLFCQLLGNNMDGLTPFIFPVENGVATSGYVGEGTYNLTQVIPR